MIYYILYIYTYIFGHYGRMRNEKRAKAFLAQVGDVFSQGDNISLISVLLRPVFDANASSHVLGDAVQEERTIAKILK